MRIVCISDTHGAHRQVEVPEGDILIHAGDLSAHGTADQIVDFDDWLSTLTHPQKVLICGNHDWFFEKSPDEAPVLIKNAHYLQESGVEINGLKIWGSPITPFFFDFAFNRQPGEDIQKHWDIIPEDTDILITHGPPYGILDQNFKGDPVGCPSLRKKVDQIKPKLHIFGHIHEANGLHKNDQTTFVNASIMTLNYKPTQNAIIVDI